MRLCWKKATCWKCNIPSTCSYTNTYIFFLNLEISRVQWWVFVWFSDMGCHIDGFIAVVAHTHVLQEGLVSGRASDVIAAANTAAEVALRLVRPGKKVCYISSFASFFVECSLVGLLTDYCWMKKSCSWTCRLGLFMNFTDICFPCFQYFQFYLFSHIQWNSFTGDELNLI